MHPPVYMSIIVNGQKCMEVTNPPYIPAIGTKIDDGDEIDLLHPTITDIIHSYQPDGIYVDVLAE